MALCRWRDKWGPGTKEGDVLFWEPAHFVMERKMLRTVKRLAERSVLSGVPREVSAGAP